MASKRKCSIKFNVKIWIFLILFVFIIFFLKKHFVNRDGILEINGANIIYLALNESRSLNLEIITKKDGNINLNYQSNNEKIFEVNDDGVLTAKQIGSADLVISTISGKNKIINVIVTDLIVEPTYAQDKKDLTCGIYSDSDSKILDQILKTEIDNAGLSTRAGVVAAARFLSLKFPYKINYFFENGRLSDETREYIDGEGRYYHEGLYLSEEKYSTLRENASTANPMMWGCDLYSNYVETYSRNGLNCSGFISWAMLNGGFDVGDIGAGITLQYDFSDMGEKVPIDNNLLISGKVKVGDLIGRDGHIAIIIGLTNDKIYIAESYVPSMKVREFTYEELVQSDDFKYIMLMDSIYKSDGYLTNMW